MKIRFIIALAVVLPAFGFGFSSDFSAAETVVAAVGTGGKCAIPSFRDAYRQSKAVFVGEVVGEEKRGDTRVFEFRVDKYWKGADRVKVEIDVYETSRYQAWFRTGGKYLIYANVDNDGRLRVGRCSRSRDSGAADDDLKQLGKGRKPR